MNKSIQVFSFVLFHFSLSAQILVQGTILDENKTELVGATVVLLEPVDSSMMSFGISDNDGIFTMEDVEAGDYVLQVSFVSYKTMYAPVKINGEIKKVNIGAYHLEPTSEILQEVTVKAEHIPMGILGDTISYNAAAFKVRPGATVEDLLKKLPGVEVQRDGSIKAMGEDVENVLVDGKEFFGNDPKIATKNLEAEAVDKVQVFDKKSEIAEFTGIDDGNEEKTINLKLKEEYKKGGFGNANLAGGTESTYEGKINYNRFSPKMQAAVILGANNVNKQAFSFNEYISFMGGLGNAISGSNSNMNFGEFGGGSTPQGITDNISTGLNFNYDLSSKLKLNSHYFYINTDQDLRQRTSSNQFTERGNFTTLDTTSSNLTNQNHRLNIKLDYKPNPYNQIIWKNTLSTVVNNDSSLSETIFSEMNAISGITSSDYNSSDNQRGYDGSLTFRKKYKKKGRNWINTAKYQYGVLDQSNNVFNQQQNDLIASMVNQLQAYDYQRDNLSYESAYTEPLGKALYVSGNYKYNYETESPIKTFFDIQNEENILNTDLSSAYNKRNFVQTGRLNLKKNTKKSKLNVGLGLQSSIIKGSIKDESTTQVEELRNQSFFFLPSFSYDYDLPRDANIEVNYWTSITLPTLSQLAPLPDNSNPNILIVGNPSLSPSYTHGIRLNYRAIDQFNFKNFFANISYNRTNDRVINTIAIDDNFIKTIKPINTDLFSSLRGYASYSAQIRPLKLKYNVRSSLTWSKYNSSLNNQISQVNESNVNINLQVSNKKTDIVDIATGLDLNLNKRKYDINSDFDQSFSNYSLFIDGIFYIDESFSLSSKFDYRSYSNAFFSESQSFSLWSAYIRKSFNEGKVAITLSINDILNQNRGIERFGGLNALYDTRYNTRARYAMLGVQVKLGRSKNRSMITL